MRTRDLAGLPLEKRPNTTALVEERETVRQILADPELAGRRGNTCGELFWNVDRGLRVFCGGACDSGGITAAVPGLRDEFLVGILGEDGFLPLLESYRRQPPRPLQLLDQVTWGELAQRYGDRDNDELYYLHDLPENKWAAQYLLDGLWTWEPFDNARRIPYTGRAQSFDRCAEQNHGILSLAAVHRTT